MSCHVTVVGNNTIRTTCIGLCVCVLSVIKTVQLSIRNIVLLPFLVCIIHRWCPLRGRMVPLYCIYSSSYCYYYYYCYLPLGFAIKVQPMSVVCERGKNVSLTCKAEPEQGTTYQWYFNGAPMRYNRPHPLLIYIMNVLFMYIVLLVYHIVCMLSLCCYCTVCTLHSSSSTILYIVTVIISITIELGLMWKMLFTKPFCSLSLFL